MAITLQKGVREFETRRICTLQKKRKLRKLGNTATTDKFRCDVVVSASPGLHYTYTNDDILDILDPEIRRVDGSIHHPPSNYGILILPALTFFLSCN